MRKTTATPNTASQPLLPLWTPTVQIPQGDGSVLVKPGRPVEYMTPLQFAKAVGYSRSAVYEQIGGPSIPEQYIRRVGPRLIKIQAGAVEHFISYWRSRCDGGISST
jgi:hypothetical protein